MTFNPDLQYRCTIIRGKSISRMDDYLPIYAGILNETCPIPSSRFNDVFDKKLSHYLKDDPKTIKNHRTENAGKLLGMYLEKDGIICISERTKKFLNDNDQPAFFKSVCFRFQQPNGSQKIQTIIEKIQHKISIKPYHFVLALLNEAANNQVKLTKDEVSFYVLNALETLQGKVGVREVLKRILLDRKNKVINKVETPDKAYSYSMQHINEQFDYLELSNLIRKDSKNIWLNTREQKSIALFINDLNNPLSFSFDEFNLEKDGVSGEIEDAWQEYFGNIFEIEIKSFTTNIESLEAFEKEAKTIGVSTIELGDEGENFVLKIERERVKKFNPRLVNKINFHGKTKGLGYDITSIEADRNPKNPEFSCYIEVKATKRVHPPNFKEAIDTINLTRNEWVAAEQHSQHFYIYRIYFTTQGTFISIINNPVKKSEEGILYATPTCYRLEFNDLAVDEKLKYG